MGSLGRIQRGAWKLEFWVIETKIEWLRVSVVVPLNVCMCNIKGGIYGHWSFVGNTGL